MPDHRARQKQNGMTEDAFFKNVGGNFTENAGQFLTSSGTARQTELARWFTFRPPPETNGSCF